MDINYFIDELGRVKATIERLIRSAEQMRDTDTGQSQGEYALSAPRQVEYDHSRLDAPPRPVQPQSDVPNCNCGLPAVLKSGTAKSTGKAWSGYFCSHKPSDQRNCGYKKWID